MTVEKEGCLLETATTMYSFNRYAISYVNRVNTLFQYSENSMNTTALVDSRGQPYKQCLLIVPEDKMDNKAVRDFIKVSNILLDGKKRVISWRLVPRCEFDREKRLYRMTSSFSVC
jgi:hypothetical protein